VFSDFVSKVVGDLLFVRNVPDSHIQDEVASLGKLRVFGIGIKLLSLGVVSPGMFVLLRGLVHLRTVDDSTVAYSRASVETFERTETTSPFGHVGSFFGLASCLFSMPMPKSVIVVSPFAHFLYISSGDLERLVSIYPQCKLDLYRMAAIEMVNLLYPEAAQALDEADEGADSRDWKSPELDEDFIIEKFSDRKDTELSQHEETGTGRDITESRGLQPSVAGEKGSEFYSAAKFPAKVTGLDSVSYNRLHSIRYAAFLLRHLSNAQIVRYSWGQLVVCNFLETEKSTLKMICGMLLTGDLVKVTTSEAETSESSAEITAPALIREKSGSLTVKSDFAILAVV